MDFDVRWLVLRILEVLLQVWLILGVGCKRLTGFRRKESKAMEDQWLIKGYQTINLLVIANVCTV